MKKIKPKTLEENYLLFVGKIIRKGLEEEGADWLRTSCAKFWCNVVSADEKAIHYMSTKQPFAPLSSDEIKFDGCYIGESKHKYFNVEVGVNVQCEGLSSN